MQQVVAAARAASKANKIALEQVYDVPDDYIRVRVAAQAGKSTTDGLSRQDSAQNKNTKSVRTAAAHTVNLRDCGSVSSMLRPGRLFRSSQVMSSTEVSKLGLKSVLDLRFRHKNCKGKANARISSGWLPCTCGQPRTERAQAVLELGTSSSFPCHVCSDEFGEVYRHECSIFHADILPFKAKMLIFHGMPTKTKLKTLVAPCFGASSKAVMALAVADDQQLGYQKLYRLILDHSKKEIAKALRVFANPANYPILVHCVHGKDRTGLIVMLVMLMCSVEPETVVLDYIQSEVQLKSSRDNSQLDLAGYLTVDAVMAAKADVMEGTIEYLNYKYGSITAYAKLIGLSPQMISQIRSSMMAGVTHQDILSSFAPPDQSVSSLFSCSTEQPLPKPSKSKQHVRSQSDLAWHEGKASARVRMRRFTTGDLGRSLEQEMGGSGLNAVSKQPWDLLINKL